jgi:ABC-type antimicrobial peptide transport system permease subunit
MIRWEAATTSAIGSALGMVLGLVCAAVLLRAIATESLPLPIAMPPRVLAPIGLIAAVTGLLAAMRPSSHAARVQPVDTIRADR